MAIFSTVLKSWIFWLILCLIIVRVVFVFIFGNGFRTMVSDQLLSQKQIIARSEATNAEFFFEKFGNNLATIAQFDSIKRHDKSAITDLDVFVDQQRELGFVGGIILTDSQGVVQFNSNVFGTKDVGVSIADRDYFIWAKNEGGKGKYFVSQPVISALGATKGQTIVVVASPVYQNGIFVGVLAASIKLQPLVERFFGLIKESNTAEVYIFDQSSKLLYNNATSEVDGDSIDQIFSNDEVLADNITNAFKANKEGKFQTEKHLVAYTPVELENQHWMLIISSSIQEVEDLERPFRIRQMALTTLSVLTLLSFGVLLFWRRRV